MAFAIYLPAILGTLLSCLMMGLLVLRKPRHTWQWATVVSLACALWCFCQILWIAADTVAEAILACQIQYFAITLLPVAWLRLALHETGNYRLLSLLSPVFLVVPAISLALALQYSPGNPNPLWEAIQLPPTNRIPQVTYGPWFWVMAVHSYTLIGLGCLLMYIHYSQSRHYRVQLWVTTLLPLVCLVLNGFYITRQWPFELDPTPLGFVIGFFVWCWATFRHGLFDHSPFSRHISLDQVNDGFVMLDQDGRVLDFNRAAGRFLGEGGKHIGASIYQLLPRLPALGSLTEPKIIQVGAGQYWEVSAAPPHDTHPRSGLILTIHDATHQRQTYNKLLQTQNALEEANWRLEQMAHTDDLTGLANRRFLHARLQEEFARANRLNQPLGLIYIDIDHFKTINDTYGHSVGDHVLKNVARELLSHRKGIDIAARYGGEEFLIVATNTDENGIVSLAGRIWQGLQAIEHDLGEARIQVPASLGVTFLEVTDKNAFDLIHRADKALYMAKTGGRNRVCLYTSGTSDTLFQ